MNTLPALFRKLRSQLLYILGMPAFFLCFVLIYQPSHVTRWLEMGEGMISFNATIIMCILLGVMIISRVLMMVLSHYQLRLNWLRFVYWEIAELITMSLFMALYLTLMYKGAYPYFHIVGQSLYALLIVCIYPYVIFNIALAFAAEKEEQAAWTNDSTKALFTAHQNQQDSLRKAQWKKKYPRETIELPMQVFDPNTADYRTLVAAGLPRDIAVGIIRWREAGKVYRVKEDLALCYNMTDSLYFAIESQIVIGDKYKFHPEEWAQKSDEGDNKADKRGERGKRAEPRIELKALNLDTVGLRYLTLAGFTIREAELVLRYRDIIGGYRCVEEFAECYAVDSVMLERLRPHLVFTQDQSLRKRSKSSQ